MKKAGLTHPKLLDLASRLRIPRLHAAGILDALWAWTGDFAPRGDVGRFPDGSIAGACDWTGDATSFVGALVASRWLDRHPAHRLIVHDWKDHIPRWVLANLKRNGQTAVSTTVETTVGTVVATTVATPLLSSPILSSPLQSETIGTPRRVPVSAGRRTYPPGFIRAWNSYPHHPSRKRKAAALVAWKRCSLESSAEAVVAWIEAQKRTADWTREGGTYVPAMGVWLSKVDFSEPPEGSGLGCKRCNDPEGVGPDGLCDYCRPDQQEVH